MHSLPLAEIIQLAVNVENPNSKKVQEIWHSFIDEFKNEINVLVDVPENELVKFNEKIGKKIIAFRNGYVLYVPGGGGAYGKPILCDSENEWKKKKQELEADLNCSASDLGQKSLFEF
jgi:PHP family Zn ribbon phosphoesterase